MGCNESKNVELVSNKPSTTQKSPAGNSVAPQKNASNMQQSSSPQKKCAAGPIKFTHFNDGGRCEPLLMLFAYGGIQFENEIINPNDWEAMKPKIISGTLPVMTVGCETITSSVAMLTYLGAEAGLQAETHIDQAAIESMVYMIEDCRAADLFLNRFLLITKSMDEETRIAKAKEFTEGALANMSKYIESHITGSTYLLSKLSIADFWLYGTMKAITDMFAPDAWSCMGPKVQQWRANFESIPQIKSYLEGTKSPKPTLVYFENVRGRIEPYRMLIAHSGLECDDKPMKFDEWPSYKPQTPLGFLPVLEVGDVHLTTSQACLKYLALETGLHGGDEEECCDSAVYVMEDCRSFVFPNRFLIRQNQMDEETKAAKTKELVEGELQKMIDYVEVHMTGDKWFLNELSVADFYLYGTIEIIEDCMVPDIWSRMGPKVQKWKEHFESLPKVKSYLDSRPKDYKL